MSIVGESRLRRSLREADAGGKKVWPLGEKVAGARVPGGHTKRHTVRARGSHQMPHRGMRSVPRGHTKRHTGQGGSSAGRAQAGARDQDAGSGSGGGSLEEASDSEDGRGPGTAQSARRADRTQDVRPGHASSVGKSATERSGAQGSWRSICGFHADRCKFVRFCTRSGSDNPSLALCEGTRPGVMRKRYHAERN